MLLMISWSMLWRSQILRTLLLSLQDCLVSSIKNKKGDSYIIFSSQFNFYKTYTSILEAMSLVVIMYLEVN